MPWYRFTERSYQSSLGRMVEEGETVEIAGEHTPSAFMLKVKAPKSPESDLLEEKPAKAK